MKTLLFFGLLIAAIVIYFRYLRTEEQPVLLSTDDFDNNSMLIEVDHPGIIYDRTKKYLTDGENHQKFFHFTTKLRCDTKLEGTLRRLLASNQDGEKYEYTCFSDKWPS